jgi:hypothetical protein
MTWLKGGIVRERNTVLVGDTLYERCTSIDAMIFVRAYESEQF